MFNRSSVTGLTFFVTTIALASPAFARMIPMPISACTEKDALARADLRFMPVTDTALVADAFQRPLSINEVRLARRSTALDHLIHTSICIGC